MSRKTRKLLSKLLTSVMIVAVTSSIVTVHATVSSLDRMIDLYTEWPYPFGGQGMGMPSDMYWPQKTVKLYANVTYNDDAVQHEWVTFEINHTGTTKVFDFVVGNFTDEYGVAWVEFRLPWPCEDPVHEVFGIWHVIATVEIESVVVGDTLDFEVWWLTEITSVVPKKPEFVKCNEPMIFDVYFRTMAMQTYTVYIAVVVYDELSVPIGSTVFSRTVGGAQYCAWATYNQTVEIPCVKYAFVGTATVRVNCLWPALPWQGGSGICPEVTATFGITKPP